jgi:hypothetical protein
MMMMKQGKRERDISTAKENDWFTSTSNPTLRFMFNIGVIKDNFGEAMEDLRKLL